MSDNDINKLIGRLRSYVRSSKGDIFAAVDTIEALRAEIDQNRIDLEEYRRDVESLTAERDRLKAALERVRNEKVAGGHDKIMPGEVESFPQTPATEPAPACEWRLDMLPEFDGVSYYVTACNDMWSSWYCTPKDDNYSYCPSCGKTVKFKEAKE